MDDPELRRWQRRAARERQARLDAEAVAEQATSALYASNTRLETANQQLVQTTNQQLAQTEALYRELFARNPLPLYVVDRENLRFLEVNDTAQAHYGFERAEFLELTLRDIEPVAALEAADRRRATLDPAQPATGLWQHVTRDGRTLEVELSIHPVQWTMRPAWLIVAHDVTVQRRDQRTLELRTRAMEASHNGMFICSARDATGSILYVNAAMARLAGQPRAALMGRPWLELFEPAAAREAAYLVPALEAEQRAQAVITARAGEQDTHWLEVQVTAVADEQGTTGHWIGVVQDITERKNFEATLAHRAGHDDLTGLPNRATLRRHLTDVLATAGHAGHEVAVLCLDLDGFKQINDSGGHDAGDAYLQTITRRLDHRIRATDMLARVGGDEFVLVTTGALLADALPELIQRLQSAFDAPVTVAGQDFSAHTSIGIACYPAHGDDAETLLRRADLTMYVAKRNGGQAVEWFSDTMEIQFRQRATIEARLQRALADHEFELHYQPQVDMRSGTIVGLEALLRWPTADAAYRSPAVFIPVAEETGLITPIGAWVLEQACADLAALRAAGRTDLTMAVNVSAVQLRDARFVDQVTTVLDNRALPAEALEIELTESVYMAENDQAMTTIVALYSLGVRLSIDDFGTGYSSLSYLSRLPLHRLKIDRSFIRAINDTAQANELVRTLASMADNLGLEALAEGVETAAERQALLDNNCVLAQGFYYSHALPMTELVEQLGAKSLTVPE